MLRRATLCLSVTWFWTMYCTCHNACAIVLGRRRCGQQGWSKRYSFNQGDLTMCADVRGAYINRNGEVPWEDSRCVFGQITYGGHFTDAWDRRRNNTNLGHVAGSSVRPPARFLLL